MLRPRLVLVAFLVFAVAGLVALTASGSVGTALAQTTAASYETPQKLRRTGRWFTDADGRVVVIHGTNMINKLAPHTPSAIGFGANDLRFLANNGFNAIRLGFTWSAVEPRPGVYNNAYINKIVALAKAAARHGMLPVVNFHQDGYSEEYGGNGAPAWANISYGVPGSPLPPPANVLPGAAIANENFWANTKAPDGIGLQDHYAAAWRHVASKFRGDTTTVFELYNEPSPGYVDVATCALPIGCPLFDQQKLAPFYDKVLRAVRGVDRERLVFVEPTAFFGLGARTWLPKTDDPQIGFAFHNYCALGLVPIPIPGATGVCNQLTGLNLSNAQAQLKATGEPLLMNEFGAFDSDEVVAALLDSADKQQLSWMHWAYWAQDFGEVSPYGLVNNPRKPPTGSNVKQGLLKVLSRPSPRVISGTPINWRWHPSAPRFNARYSTSRADGAGRFAAGAVSEFFVHPRFFPRGYRVRVQGGRVTSAKNAPTLTIAAAKGADKVIVRVTPAG